MLIDGLRAPLNQESPVVDAKEVHLLLVRGCDGRDSTSQFPRVDDEQTGRVSLRGNHGDFTAGDGQ